jgi:hypothetical protein
MCESYESTMGIYLCGESWLQPRYRFCVFMCISRSWGLGDAMGLGGVWVWGHQNHAIGQYLNIISTRTSI